MAYLGKMFIAGSELHDGLYKCGISYALAHASPISHTMSLRQDDWQVEFLLSSKCVVARTVCALSFEELQSIGFAIIQEALDLLSVKGIFSTTLSEPETSSIGVYQKEEHSVLFVYELCNFPIALRCKVTQTDASGNEIKRPLLPEPKWNESFRYFRLSQSSNDLFEAYRNMFLAFEALLNFVCPKEKKEGEALWLKRSLSIVNGVTSLDCFAPKDSLDAIQYIIDTQYRDVRCKLQHAKFPDAQLPHASTSPLHVRQAYSELVRIWRYIADVYLNVRSNGGVVMYSGFSLIMDNGFGQGVKVYFTSDSFPLPDEEITISPNNAHIHEFECSEYLGNVQPGVVRVLANEKIALNSKKYSLPIRRIDVVSLNRPASSGYIEMGLIISGVTSWEYINDFRLINSAQPKAIFNT